ncbi:ABC transporter substrate-binding protein [Natrarchaeobius oligotrophus]|nr:ABC transporter substrate-binding protein [Natrarchaeobius chitinivorans]
MSSNYNGVNRREFIVGTAASGAVVGLAGCTGGGNGEAPGTIADDEDEYEPLPEMEFASVAQDEDALRYEVGNLAQRQIEALGIRTNREVVDVGTYSDKLNDREFDFMIAAWTGGTERLFPYYNLFYSFHSQFANLQGGNYTMFESDEYDEMVENFRDEPNEQRRIEYAQNCQEILAENVPIIFTVHPDALVAANTDQFTNWQEMVGLYAYNNIPSLTEIESVDGEDQVVFGTTEALETYPNFFNVTGPDALRLHAFTYDPLVRLNLEGGPTPAAAEDWEWVDETTLDVTLRADMTFHDGEPVTAEDVQFTFDAIQEQGIPYLGSDIDPYGSSEILDDRTVRFSLDNPFSGFVQISLYRIPIVPEHIWSDAIDEYDHPSEWSDPDMTGSGPFEFIDYEPGTQIVFEKNQDHYLADDLDFEEFVYRIYGSQSAIIGDLESGDVTFTQYMGAEHWNQANETDGVRAVSNPGLDAHGIWIPNNEGPFRDVRFRKALAHAVNQQEMIDILLQGSGDEALHPIAPANVRYHNDDVQEYPLDLDRAVELLEDAGFRWNESGELLMPIDWEPEVEYIPLE